MILRLTARELSAEYNTAFGRQSSSAPKVFGVRTEQPRHNVSGLVGILIKLNGIL